MSEAIDKLKSAILDYDNEAAARWAKVALEQGVEPTVALAALTETIRHVGDNFGKGELFLPELVGAASAMESATIILDEKIESAGKTRQSLAKIVIGTVYGDIHDIGKNMVAVLLVAEGFEVIDLGVNITSEQFVAAVKKHNADILAMSALLTTTAAEQKKVIDSLREDKLMDKLKVMVGGGAITQEFADSIGADGYSSSAPGAAKLALRLIQIKSDKYVH